MKLFEDLLVESLFSKGEIEEFREVYENALYDYLDRLVSDPFAHDYRQDDIKDKLEELWENKVKLDKGDKTFLLLCLMQYFI